MPLIMHQFSSYDRIGLPAVQCPYEASDSCRNRTTDITTEPVYTTMRPGKFCSTTVGGDALHLSASLSLITFVLVIALAGMNWM